MKTILITGPTGFIWANLMMRLFKDMAKGTIVGVVGIRLGYTQSVAQGLG